MSGAKQHKTYRDLRYTAGPVEVDRPEWAQQYAVGDQIAFESPPNGDVMTAPVAGFSRLKEHEGLPVIEIPDGIAEYFEGNVGSVTIPEHRHVPPAEVDDA